MAAMTTSLEQKARDILERMGIEGAQNFTAGDLVELANAMNHPPMHHFALTSKQLNKLADVLTNATDEGPGADGWKSKELEELRDLVEDSLAKVLPNPPPA